MKMVTLGSSHKQQNGDESTRKQCLENAVHPIITVITHTENKTERKNTLSSLSSHIINVSVNLILKHKVQLI